MSIIKEYKLLKEYKFDDFNTYYVTSKIDDDGEEISCLYKTQYNEDNKEEVVDKIFCTYIFKGISNINGNEINEIYLNNAESGIPASVLLWFIGESYKILLSPTTITY